MAYVNPLADEPATDREDIELGTSRDNYRQKLARARRDLRNFMERQCGLINAANPCRCAKKTQAFIEAGYIRRMSAIWPRRPFMRCDSDRRRPTASTAGRHASPAPFLQEEEW